MTFSYRSIDCFSIHCGGWTVINTDQDLKHRTVLNIALTVLNGQLSVLKDQASVQNGHDETRTVNEPDWND